MGYTNEFASLNQADVLKKYCDKKVKNRLKQIISARRKIEKENIDIDHELIYKPIDGYNKPAISVDGGIGTLNQGTIEEVKLIKVAYGTNEDDKEFFENDVVDPVVFHVFSGILKWAAGAGKNEKTNKQYTQKELVDELIVDFLDLEIVDEMLKNLKLSKEVFYKELFNFLYARVKKRATVDDVLREIMEWALIVNFWYKTEHKSTKEDIKCILIKDGSLFPGKQTMSIELSKALENFLLDDKFVTVGVVKASRFLSEENSWSLIINQYTDKLTGNTFFRLTDDLENQIDDKEINYERNFFSLFSGEKIFEIQLPNTISDIPVKREKVLDCLNSLVTYLYDGSIETNSFAHENASISHFDADIVSKELSYEIFSELKELLKNMDDKK